jgi:hypothetical protein
MVGTGINSYTPKQFSGSVYGELLTDTEKKSENNNYVLPK